MVNQEKLRRDTTVDPEDVARFDRLGAQWWDPMDPCKRCTSSIRSVLPIARAARPALFERRAQARLALGKGARGPDDPRYRVRRRYSLGIPAQLGARVTAVDPARRNIEVARDHAVKAGLSI